jgi:molybdopterin-containing oxidoreductase family iron-sulfur binding subunit
MPPEIETMPSTAPVEPREQWASIEEYMNTPEFQAMMHREFPEDSTEWTDPVTRRQFMTLMGASLALAGVAGCSPRPAPNRKIIPYVNQPEQVTPGVPLFFATAHVLAGVANGVVVKSAEGRPIKVEGNTLHPSSLGGCDVFSQGAILNLYDPDRSQMLTKNGIAATWEDCLKAIRSELTKQKAKKGGGIRILSETCSSPTMHKQVEMLKGLYPDVKWIQYDTISRDNVRKATKLAFNKVLNPIYDFTKADVVLSIDSDFTNDGPGSCRYARDFASRRRVRQGKNADGVPVEEMSRLYVVESMPSCTGSVADHRLAIRNSDIETFLQALAAELGVANAPKPATELTGVSKEWLKPLASDLKAKEGKSLVVVGDSQPPSVHALAYAINDKLTNINKTIFFTDALDGGVTDQLADLKTLIADMKAKTVDLLFVFDANPAYTAPRDLGFLEAMKLVPTRVHLGLYVDETAQWCNWHIPSTHFLETWSDARGHDGTVTIMQPLIAPLYDGKSVHQLITAMLDAGDNNSDKLPKTLTPLDIVRRTWQEKLKDASGGFEEAWQRAIRDGVVPNSKLEAQKVSLVAGWAGTEPGKPAKKGLEISFRADPTIYDGRFANNGWLQEVPKPITKICWDNVIIMSGKTAKDNGIDAPRVSWMGGGEHGRAKVLIAEIDYRGKKIKGPIWILPGHADGVITVHLGFGRESAGHVAMGGVYEKFDANKVGFDAYQLRHSEALSFDVEAKLTVIPDSEHIVACTQMHFSMEGRKPVRYAPKDEYVKERDFAKIPPSAAGETGPINSLVPGPHQNGKHDDHAKKEEHKDGKEGKEKHDHEHKHDSRVVPLTLLPPGPPNDKTERKWAMAIDLSACNGCTACLVACQAENNIPVVGKEQVTRGREMHWIRIDRYYQGSPDDPNNLVTLFQPVPCQQCEKAPCEIVCPVAATVHSADGLNDMVYNRCVGTRYCANNCPYKVRRFNFLTYADFATESLKLARNPEVTLRSRGVMEKCTYCVQRIRAAEIEAEREWHLPDTKRPKDANGRPRIVDGDIVTACQAACPSGAIVFGDIMDTHSKVSHWKAEPTNYGLLAELNTMPRTTYLATIRNPNKELAEKLKKSEKGA